MQISPITVLGGKNNICALVFLCFTLWNQIKQEKMEGAGFTISCVDSSLSAMSGSPKTHYFWRIRHAPIDIFEESGQHGLHSTSIVETKFRQLVASEAYTLSCSILSYAMLEKKMISRSFWQFLHHTLLEEVHCAAASENHQLLIRWINELREQNHKNSSMGSSALGHDSDPLN